MAKKRKIETWKSYITKTIYYVDKAERKVYLGDFPREAWYPSRKSMYAGMTPWGKRNLYHVSTFTSTEKPFNPKWYS